VTAFVLVLVLQAVWPEGEGTPVMWSDVSAAVYPLSFTRETKRVFRSEPQLASYLARVGASRRPRFDFGTRQLLLVSPGPRSSTGYGVEVVGVRRHGDRIDVVVRERAPSLNERVTARVSFPYRLLSLPREGDVYVDWRGR
jgi:hypothetical protein